MKHFDGLPVVAYINTYAYARGPANELRSAGVVGALKELGFRVDSMSTEAQISGRWSRLLGRLRLQGRGGSLALGSAVTEWLESLETRPQVIWLYGLDVRYSARAFAWARRNHVPVVCEVVDWYELKDQAGLLPKVILGLTNWIMMPLARRRASGFVVCSRLLSTYFGTTTPIQIVPAVVPSSDDSPMERSSTCLRVAYVGSPGRRDAPVLQNLQVLAESWQGDSLCIDVAGVPLPEISWRTSAQDQVTFHGRLPRAEAVALVARSDATLLQREANRRFAQAGFPSKVAESMMAGTAPITNASSDLDLYLIDGEDSVLLEDASAGSLHRGVERMASLTISKRRVKETAASQFSEAAAAERIATLMTDIGVQ